MTDWTPEKIEHACRTLLPGFDPWRDADGFYFDHATARHVIDFFQECLCFTNSKWAGLPWVLQPFQIAIICNTFAWKSKATGLRRFRKVLVWTARGSGKTELAAGCCLYALYCDGEPRPECLSLAGSSDQAEKVHHAASFMVAQEPELANRSRIFKRSIESTANGGAYKVINASARTKHGGSTHFAAADELHCIDDPELIDVIETSMRKRRQPILFMTSTAGSDPESIAGEIHEYAQRVRDGVVSDPTFLPCVWEAPHDADIEDPKTWLAAQPALNVTVTEQDYRQELAKARSVPRYMATFRQLFLNQWTEAASAWVGLEDWKRCGSSIDIELLRGKRAAIGVDLSTTTDTSAAVVAVEDGDRVVILPHIFIPNDNAAGRHLRQRRDKAPILSWINERHITATEGNVVDYGVIEQKVLDLAKLFTISEVQMDPFNATASAQRLLDAGLPVVFTRQGWSLGQATKETERLILARSLVHANNPAFNWQVSCAAVKSDEHDNHWIVKSRSTGRVDSVVAMIMAINALRFGKGADVAAGPHYYEQHPELIVLG